MFNQFTKITKCCFLAMLLLISSGCAGTSVVSKTESSASVYKLTTAQVVWTGGTSLSYTIFATGRGYQPTIGDAEKAYAQNVIGQLLFLFHNSAALRVREQLAKSNVLDGNDVILELTPVTANCNINGGRGFDIRASIKKNGAPAEIWSVIIRAFGPPFVKDQVLLDNFVIALSGELKKSGWLE